MKKKKLLYINNFEAPYRVPFFNFLGEKYDMTLVLSQKPEERKERHAEWFVEHKRNYQVVYLHTKDFLGKKVGFEIKQFLDKYDIVFMDMYANPTNIYAIWCLNRIKKRFIMSVDGMLPRQNESLLYYKIKKYLLSSPALIMSPSESVDRCLVYYGVSLDNIRRYHFTSLTNEDILKASSITENDKAKAREKLNIKEKKVVLSVGRFSYEGGYGKGYDLLMKIGEQLGKDIGIYIIGDEPTEEFITWKREKKLTQVHFIGFKNKNDLSDYYIAADLFVLLTKADVWGLVINEAMSFGLPIVTTDKCVAGIKLVKNDINGYIVPTGDFNSSLVAISCIITNDELLQQFSKNSIKIIKEYSIEKMGEDHISTFSEFSEQ